MNFDKKIAFLLSISTVSSSDRGLRFDEAASLPGMHAGSLIA
jgi:hypothetical protein